MSAVEIGRFRELDSCAVSDALTALRIEGCATGLASVGFAKRICGTVVTVQLGPATSEAPPRHLCTAAVEASGPSDVIVVSGAGRVDTASWGGILSLAAVQQGVEGVVIDGACRDIDESREFGLAVFARSVIPRTARGRVVERDWGVPITVCDVRVSPGDVVVADGSGVVFVPADRAVEVADAADRIMRRERLMAERVRAGESVARVMSADYERMLERP